MIKEQEAGMKAVQMAALLCQAVGQEMLTGSGSAKLDKQDRSPVTVADFGAQAVVCQMISQAFPNDAIVGEEDSQALREPEHAHLLAMVKHFVSQTLKSSASLDEQRVCEWIDKGNGSPKGRYWVLDPIDGTKGFLRNDQYAIALALIEDGVVQWGFLGCPSLPYEGGKGQLLVAGRGAGTSRFTLDGDSLGAVHVSQTQNVANSRLAESFVAAHTNRGLAENLKELLAITNESLRMDSQAKYAAVAAGDADIYLRAPNPRTPNYREKIWDHAAGSLVVEEAGGIVTDIYGCPLDWSHGRQLLANVGIVATNGHLHKALIEGIAELLGE